MDWMNRGSRQNQPANQSAANGAGTVGAPTGHDNNKNNKKVGGLGIASVVLLFSATIVVVATIWLLGFSGTSQESKFVDKSRLQAVFLNGGQVYFGKIQNLDDNYMRLGEIYYLRVNQQVQPNQAGQQQQQTQNDISLVKLGCELHGPQDEMLINREQVIFWENLKDDGQVAKAVAEYVKQNPDGQKCQTTTQQPNTNSGNGEQQQNGAAGTQPAGQATGNNPAQ